MNNTNIVITAVTNINKALIPIRTVPMKMRKLSLKRKKVKKTCRCSFNQDLRKNLNFKWTSRQKLNFKWMMTTDQVAYPIFMHLTIGPVNLKK